MTKKTPISLCFICHFIKNSVFLAAKYQKKGFC